MSILKRGTPLLWGAFVLGAAACAPRAVVETPAVELGNGGVEDPPAPRVVIPEAPPLETGEGTSGHGDHEHHGDDQHREPRDHEVHDHDAHVRGSKDAGVTNTGSDDEEKGYVCPMHPDIRSDRPIECPRCGMKLERP